MSIAENPRKGQTPVFASVDADQAVAELLDRVIAAGASDLFMMTNEFDVTITMRHLGIVRPVEKIPLDEGRRWMMSIKALAGIPIDLRKRPTEGRWIREHANGSKTDLRINSIPTLHGEDFSIRFLRRDSALRKLENLGLSNQQLHELLAMLNSPSGLILVTGPTSSGKTTTLYACLQHLNNGERKINTIEDPIEYAVESFRQSQVSAQYDLDFPDLLRNVLRQSPDIIMIGEIRDTVTAQTAVRAANSGHLVFATLHAPTASGAVESMVNLNVHPHFLSSSLCGVLAQRLVRTLCPACRMAIDISGAPVTFAELTSHLEPHEGKQIFATGQCDACGQTGYTSREGVFEVLTITPELRQAIVGGRTSQELESLAVSEGMMEFRRAGLLKVAKGRTTMEEVLRTIPAELLGTE